MEKEELKKRIAKYINKTVSYGYGDGFVQIDYTSPDGVEHIYIEEDIDDFTFIDFLEDYTLDILQQEIDRAREEEREEIISELEGWKVAHIDRTREDGAEYLRDALIKLLTI